MQVGVRLRDAIAYFVVAVARDLVESVGDGRQAAEIVVAILCGEALGIGTRSHTA